MMDRLQTSQFIDLLSGFKTIGVADDEAVRVPHSPELRAFIVGYLGENTPDHGDYIVYSGHDRHRAAALSAFLREVADSIDHHAGITP